MDEEQLRNFLNEKEAYVGNHMMLVYNEQMPFEGAFIGAYLGFNGLYREEDEDYLFKSKPHIYLRNIHELHPPLRTSEGAFPHIKLWRSREGALPVHDSTKVYIGKSEIITELRSSESINRGLDIYACLFEQESKNPHYNSV